ncbi:MAG: SCO family protein [Planctomycetota bacterium]|jgi:protein SCO1/2|nr:SCO family protein [Planctomycetota bacterium]MDP6762288.1 SCO family protein [Planctomycetota bacterium]MDP6990324.1 SCO family protein [Planctomycetota bacterium]
MKRALPIALAAWILSAAGACGGEPAGAGAHVDADAPARAGAFRGRELFDAPAAPEFTLSDQHGRRFRLADHRGSVVLLFFGFVHCPDACPATLSSWGSVQQSLGERVGRVSFAFVTVDPQRDTPERLARHLAVFGEGFLGLSGTEAELAKVFDAYSVRRERVPIDADEAGMGYVVDHTTRTLLIDAEGRMRVEHDFRSRPADIAADLIRLLEE